MKKTYTFFFLLILSCLLFYSYQSLSEENEIDFLENATNEIKNSTLNTTDVYYFSNSEVPALYFKTQFVLAPKVIYQQPFSEIPINSYILIIIDKNIRSNSLISNEINRIEDTIINAIGNKYYKAILLKK